VIKHYFICPQFYLWVQNYFMHNYMRDKFTTEPQKVVVFINVTKKINYL
jgi:hypothetical protein